MSGQNGGTKIIYIKKKAKAHPHHGGAWKVAYADFVTAMMALFIVLWLLTQSDQASKERISQYFRTGVLPGGSMMAGKPAGSNPPVAVDIFPQGNPPGGMSKKSEAKKLDELAKSVEQILLEAARDPQLEPLQYHVSVKIIDEGALIELVDGGDNFLFSVASSELKPGATLFLQKLAPLLDTVKNKVEIHGHTDSRPFDPKSTKNNWDLSFERANEARKVLETSGLSAGKVIGVLAHADTALFLADKPDAPQNRRLAILVVRSSHEKERVGDLTPDTGAGERPAAEPPARPMLVPPSAAAAEQQAEHAAAEQAAEHPSAGAELPAKSAEAAERGE